jgi:hypothetical protein
MGGDTLANLNKSLRPAGDVRGSEMEDNMRKLCTMKDSAVAGNTEETLAKVTEHCNQEIWNAYP